MVERYLCFGLLIGLGTGLSIDPRTTLIVLESFEKTILQAVENGDQEVQVVDVATRESLAIAGQVRLYGTTAQRKLLDRDFSRVRVVYSLSYSPDNAQRSLRY
jgi:hypothetical protein